MLYAVTSEGVHWLERRPFRFGDMGMVSGLVVSTARGSDVAAVQRELAARGCVTVGDAEAQWIPVVIEAEDDIGMRDLHDWIGSLHGVEFVDVVHVNFDDGQGAAPENV